MGRIRYLEAIGREVRRGRPTIGPPPSKADLVRLYVKEGHSVRDVAAALGCSKDAVRQGLKKYRIEARAPAKRSQLRAYSREFLLGNIKKLGFQVVADTLGVNIATLHRHMKSR